VVEPSHFADPEEVELRYLRSCLARLPLLLTVSDRAARYVWTFNGHIGFGFDSMLGKTNLELGDHPSLRVLHELELRALATGETLCEELELPTSDGTRVLELTIAPLIERSMRVGISMIGVDIAQSEARTRLREEQLRLIAHDLRQPLNVIAIAAARLASVVDPDSPVSSLSESINASVHAMSRVLEDILETGEWETGGVLLRREPTEIGSFLRKTFTASVAPEGLLRLRVETQGVCEAEIDRAKLGRAVLNLVDNALKFSEGYSPVLVRAGREAGVLRIAVSDEGPGLDPEIARHAFDKYQASNGSRASGGKGLGLYAARLIVEAHGGRCRVVSLPGQGAIFSIELPTLRPPPAPTP
jgi:signal transduction histidine kinase